MRAFLLYGAEGMKISRATYYERLEDADKRLTTKIKAKFPDAADQAKLLDDILEYSAEIENVYMEIGMQCGAKLAQQLLDGQSME